MWSSIATCAAAVAGWMFGRFTVPVPSFMVLVAVATQARNVMQEVMFSALSVTCSPLALGEPQLIGEDEGLTVFSAELAANPSPGDGLAL